MLLSMTGFGAKTISIPINRAEKLSLAIEIKSLNSRFFEATFRLPSSLAMLETVMLSLLKKKTYSWPHLCDALRGEE